HFVSGPRLTLLTVAKRWTLTSFRSGLNILAVGSCFQSGHDFFVSAQFAADFLGGRTKRSYFLLLPAPRSSFTTHHSPFPLPAPRSSLPASCSSFIIHHSSLTLPAPRSPLPATQFPNS